jgi:hypothetical protein
MSIVAVGAPVGASTDISIQYLGGAGIGTTVEIDSTLDRLGGTLAFTSSRAFAVDEKGERKLIWKGSHTKFIKVLLPLGIPGRGWCILVADFEPQCSFQGRAGQLEAPSKKAT